MLRLRTFCRPLAICGGLTWLPLGCAPSPPSPADDPGSASSSDSGGSYLDTSEVDSGGGEDSGEACSTAYYADADGDGWGDSARVITACEAPDGYVSSAGDCDDGDAARSPSALERCDGLDSNCDENMDRGCDLDFDWSACDVSVPSDYSTVQAAIDAAFEGALICVAEGTWYENLDFFGKGLTLLGVHGPSWTKIDAGGAGVALTFQGGEGPDSIIEGLTLSGGDGTQGSNVSIYGASPTLRRLIIENSIMGYSGGGIYVEGGGPTFEHVRVQNNLVTATLDGQPYGYGAGITLRDDDSFLWNVSVNENSLANAGGGIYLDRSHATLSNVYVSGNEASAGGGAGVYAADSQIVATNVILYANRGVANDYSPSWGAGAVFYRGSAYLTNVLVRGNLVGAGEVGGVASMDCELSLVNALITGNTDAGLSVDGGSPNIQYSDLWDELSSLRDPAGTDGNVSVAPTFAESGSQLAEGCELVDLGDPLLRDPDGSVSDIGAYGGPGAGSWDLDGDGWPQAWAPGADATGADCDDWDETLYPGSGC